MEGSKSGFNIGSAERFIKIQAPLWEKEECEYVINRMYAVAQKFEGHEGNEQSDEDDYLNPLHMPLSDLLDYFTSADKIWELSKTQLDSLSSLNPLNIGKKKRLKRLQDSIGEDTERVAEAVVYAIAEEVSDKNPRLARLLGKFEGSLSQEEVAENAYDNSVNVYAHTASYAASNPMASTGSIIGMANASDFENQSEAKRVRLTKEIIDSIGPELETLSLTHAISEWVSFSN